jgi:hypothetical protein
MARGSSLRASDSDRELIAERLRQATAEGRLLAAELEDRLERLFSSRTYGELDALVSDLPADRARRSPAAPPWLRAGIVLAAALAVLAVTAVVLLILAGLAGAWIAWVVLGWMFFGGRGRCGRRSRPIGPEARHRRKRARAARSGPVTL